MIGLLPGLTQSDYLGTVSRYPPSDRPIRPPPRSSRIGPSSQLLDSVRYDPIRLEPSRTGTAYESTQWSFLIRALNAPHSGPAAGPPAASTARNKLFAGLKLRCVDRNARYDSNANRATHGYRPLAVSPRFRRRTPASANFTDVGVSVGLQRRLNRFPASVSSVAIISEAGNRPRKIFRGWNRPRPRKNFRGWNRPRKILPTLETTSTKIPMPQKSPTLETDTGNEFQYW
jgi:hypothetical protein